MSKLYKAQTQQGHSRGFYEYIRSVGESKSKQEEDEIVLRDLVDLKKALTAKIIDKRLLKEYVVRIFYAEMLGLSAEFAHIHCVNLSSSTDLLFKRTGYLGTWLTVNPEHDLMYLIVSNLQRDMKSSSFLDVAAALTAAAKMVRHELMSAINAEVVGLLGHANALVRKKVVQAMHAFYRKSDGVIGDQKLFRQALCDRDPAVMGAALRLFADVVRADAASQRDLIPTFTSILKQITEHRLPRDYDYHRIPAPWFQMKILQILAMLVGDDPLLAQKCEEALTEVIKRAENGLNIGYAVTCEAISVITRIPTIPSLVELAAEAIANFLSGKNANLRYAGIEALAQIVRVDPKYAREHQQVVMTCLEDADDTIRRKTMMLLLAMCNEDNVDAIVTRLIKSLSHSTDRYMRQDLTRRICDAAERFSPGAVWYIESMNKVLLCAAEHVPQPTIQGMLKLIAEGEGVDEAGDAAFRTYCVETYFDLVESTRKNLPEAFSRVAAWVMGEYGFLTKRISRTMLLDRLCDMLERAENVSTRGCIIMAMMKIVAHAGSMPDNVEELIERFKDSRSVGLQQRCYEFMELVKMPVLMKKVLPLDGCCEQVEVDEGMEFLNETVQEALLVGAKPYEKRTVRLGMKEEEETLRTDAYKVQRADIVDESELDPERFKTDEPHQLFIRPSARRWGVKNLEEEAAAATTTTTTTTTEAGMKELTISPDSGPAPTGGVEYFPDGTVLHHVDPSSPMPRENVKPSKNERFLNDIFGGTTKKKATTRSRGEAAEIFPNGGKTPEVSGGPSLSIHIAHVMEEAAMGITVQVVAKTAVGSVVIDTKAPANCTLRTVSCSAPVASVNGSTTTLATLHANQSITINMQLLPVAFPGEGSVQVDVAYRSALPGDPQHVVSTMALRPSFILRPATQMTTQQFGQAWVNLSGECKVQLTSATALTPDSLQRLLMDRASLCVVEVIRSEVIAAAVLLGTGQLLLCHVAVVSASTANVTVRAQDYSFAAHVARIMAAQ